MPRNIVAFPLISIEFSREEISVETLHPTKVPDTSWRFVDAAGHGHFWEGENLPTLEWISTGKTYVGDEFDGCEYDVGEWRCRICSEVVKPKETVTYGPRSVPGPTTVFVEVEGERFRLTETQYGEAVDLWAKTLRKITTKRKR